VPVIVELIRHLVGGAARMNWEARLGDTTANLDAGEEVLGGSSTFVTIHVLTNRFVAA